MTKIHDIISKRKKKPGASEILLQNIEEARSELERAESIFNELTSETAIDYASYNILAARAKYSYLINLAKEQGLKF